MAKMKGELVDMKLKPGEREEMYGLPKTEREGYPYGLCIRLENQALDKLGMKSLPKPGEKFFIEAQAMVESVHVSESKENEGDRCVSLQIVAMGLTKSYKDTD